MTENTEQLVNSELALVASEFNSKEAKGLLTPDFVTATFQKIWQVRGERIGLNIVIDPCDRTTEELAELTKNGRRIGYLPQQLKTQEERLLLGNIFPHLASYVVRVGLLREAGKPTNGVVGTNEADRSGWFDYEASIAAPYLDTTEEGLREAIAAEAKKLNRELFGMNLNEYIVAGQDTRLLTGHWPDEPGSAEWEFNGKKYITSTSSRLLGSRTHGNVVSPSFHPNGHLEVPMTITDIYGKTNHSLQMGGRSVGYKKV
jgi:hypothetical protein